MLLKGWEETRSNLYTCSPAESRQSCDHSVIARPQVPGAEPPKGRNDHSGVAETKVLNGGNPGQSQVAGE